MKDFKHIGVAIVSLYAIIICKTTYIYESSQKDRISKPRSFSDNKIQSLN